MQNEDKRGAHGGMRINEGLVKEVLETVRWVGNQNYDCIEKPKVNSIMVSKSKNKRFLLNIISL